MSVGALTYSTVFRSRLGALNLALECSDRSFAARARIKRNLENKLKQTRVVSRDDAAWTPLVGYLVEKGFVSKAKGGKAKYKFRYEKDPAGPIRLFDAKGAELREVTVAIADVWLSDDRIRSTIGVPTVENVEEVLDFAIQLEIISASKGNWTSAGKIASELRGADEANPFIPGAEVALFARTLFQRDGWLLKPMVQRLGGLPRLFTREDMIGQFGDIVGDVEAIVGVAIKDKDQLKEFAAFLELVRKNLKKRADKEADETINLGVLEHRVSPRLEWLTDLRVLAKEQKNAFSYMLGEDYETMVRAVEYIGESESSRDEAALRFLTQSSWARHELSGRAEADPFRAMMNAYALVRPPVGPARIDDVCFMAGLLMRDADRTMDACRDHVLELSRTQEGITVSGDRFTKAPRLVHVKERLWKK